MLWHPLLSLAGSADITAFLGVNHDAARIASTKGVRIGAGLVIVGFEFEYAHRQRGHLPKAAPALRTFMFNGLLQTPIPIAGMQFYGTAGGGVYRETLNDDRRRTSASTSAAA